MTTINLLPKQMEFLQSNDEEVAFVGGIGCIHDSALIETINGKFHPSEIKEPTLYKSFDGVCFEYALGSAPYLKGEGDLYRVSHEQGEFVALGSHLIFSSHHRYSKVSDLYDLCNSNPSSFYLLPSNLELYQKVPLLNVLHLSNIALGSLCDYLGCKNLYDEQPLLEVNIFQDVVPSPAYVQEFCHKFFLYLKLLNKDGLEEHVLRNNQQDYSAFLQSKQDFFHHMEELASFVEDHTFSEHTEHIWELFQQDQLLKMKSLLHQIVLLLKDVSEFSCFSFKSPSLYRSKIISIKKEGLGQYWDLEVYKNHNYVANGCVHHNSSKTSAGSLFVISETAQYPKKSGIIVGQSYGQVVHATLANLKEWCEKLGIYYKYNSSTKMVTVNQTNHYVRSAENFDTSRGIQGSFLWIDECAYVEEEAINMFIGRIRVNGGSLKKRFTTSPAGFNHFYHRFHKSGDNYHPSRKMIITKTEDNYFLPKSYIENLRLSYSPKLAAQELDSEFVSLTGLSCYYEFDRNKHVQDIKHLFKNTPSQQLYVFQDVNLDPMAGVVAFMENGNLFVIDEIFIEGGTDLRTLADLIKTKWGKYDPIVVFDGTASTKRNIFNIKETANKLMESFGLRTEKMFNPLVVKRLAHTNNVLFQNKVLIDISCKNLIRDLEQVQYGKDGNDIDKTNKLLSHVSDGFSYSLWKLMPPEDTKRPSKTILF